jgi:hypothetical protein
MRADLGQSFADGQVSIAVARAYGDLAGHDLGHQVDVVGQHADGPLECG